ncbi:MAG: helix-turn-helix transcriptional regulator [Devosia sp.]
MPKTPVIDRIYEAAAVPEFWPEVLAELARLANAWGSSVLSFDPHGNVKFMATPGYEQIVADFAAKAQNYDNARPKRHLAAGHVGFQFDLELFTREELKADPIYQDFLYPAGLQWSAGTVIPVPTRDMIVFDLSRTGDQGIFDRETMLKLDLYRPHLARAAFLAHRFGLKAARDATDAMAALGLPAAALAADGRVISSNAALDRLAPRIKAAAYGRIALGQRPADAVLTGALRSIVLANGGGQSIPLPASHDGPALILHLVPVRGAAHDVFALATAILVVTMVDTPSAPLTEVLTGLFDLTAAESRVARGVATGMPIEEIARAAGLSRETVRSQLKSVMLKTGTSRQIELALLLAGHRLPVDESGKS